MVNLKKYTISGARDKKILIDLTIPNEAAGLVIFCHGYKGYKDWGAWQLVAKHFANKGYAFLKFNFSYNGGTPEEPIDFPDLEAFAQNNYSTELKDLNLVIDFAVNNQELKPLSSKFLGLTGHSRGGGMAILGASERSEVTGLTTWSAVSNYENRFPKGRAFDAWKETGRYTTKNGRTMQDMPHYFQFFEDFEKHRNRLTIETRVSEVKCPWLIIHGKADPVVAFKEAESLYEWSENALLLSLEDAKHTYGSRHPHEGSRLPEDLEEVCNATLDFFNTITSEEE